MDVMEATVRDAAGNSIEPFSRDEALSSAPVAKLNKKNGAMPVCLNGVVDDIGQALVQVSRSFLGGPVLQVGAGQEFSVAEALFASF